MMYLAQVPKTPGVHLAGIADLAPATARTNLARVGWTAERAAAPSLDAALMSGATHVSDDWQALVAHPQIDIIVEATGNPIAAVEHALAAFHPTLTPARYMKGRMVDKIMTCVILVERACM